MSSGRAFLVLVPALVAASWAAGSPAAPPGELVEYKMAETYRARTPQGEFADGLEGRVAVLGDRALWRLESGRFPRSEASAVLAEAGTVTLLDPAGKEYAEAPWADFDLIFGQQAAGDPGQASAMVRELTASLKGTGAGGPFGGLPSVRHSLDLKYVLAVSTPGRAATITHEVRAVIVTVEGLGDSVRSRFDGLSRLFRLRGKAREAVESELSRLEGWPVSVRIDSLAVWTSEPVGSGKDASAPRPDPVRSSATVTREVSAFVRRKATASNAGRFVIPEDFHSRPFERMVREAPGLER